MLASDVFFYDLASAAHVMRVLVRLAVAMALGALIGLERGHGGRPAGLRTHMLVCLGAALFILIPGELVPQPDGPSKDVPVPLPDLSRVIQGIVVGVGFLGAGTILKLSDTREIKGLTTAASIWLTAAVGVSVGAGWLWPAVFGTLFALAILAVITTVERWLHFRAQASGTLPAVKSPGVKIAEDD
jgi:putative Mg2+ transporter-C (MgtC) family protein